MLLSVNWLKDYIGKTAQTIDPHKLAEKLTMRGLAVDSVRESAAGLENITVGKIESIDKHPDADKLQIAHVVISDKAEAEKLQIVCGATNIAVGNDVPVATVGTVLPGDFKIKKAKIRGVESSGMLCSGKELQLSDDADGILQLPKHSKLGERLSSLLGKNDTLMEFELTANRGDCMSVLGLAREIGPLLKTRIKEPKSPRFKVTPHRTSNIIKVEVEDTKLCPRYVVHVIDSLKVEESPDWIKQRLQSVGIRTVNNIVDTTNFVMLEYGQPLHAFDLRKIESGEVRVAPCKEPKEFTLLSGDTVQLEKGDLLIQDGDRPIALAGIMGGANTQITEDSTSILLESATFNAAQIRKTARRLGLHTDSSKRFERGVDQARALVASERASALLRDGFGANVYHPPIDTNDSPAEEKSVNIDMRDVRRIIGIAGLSTEDTANHLEAIGIVTHRKSQNVLNVKFPSYRMDLTENVDVVEEVGRIMGYDKVPENAPRSIGSFHEFNNADFDFEIMVKTELSALGLRETIHYSFISEDNLKKYFAPLDSALQIRNPLSEEMKVMRTSLLPSLLETYRYNLNRKVTCQRLFEVAHTYFKSENTETQTQEKNTVAAILSGTRAKKTWITKKPEPVDFYYAKGVLEQLVSKIGKSRLTYKPLKGHGLFHPAAGAEVILDGNQIGLVGEIHPMVRNQTLETTERIVMFELELEAFCKIQESDFHFDPPSKFPSVGIDLAFIIDKAVSHEQIVSAMQIAGTELLTDVKVFDAYEGENIPLGRRSLAFHLTFSSRDKTLTDADVNSLKEKITEALTQQFEAQIRQ